MKLLESFPKDYQVYFEYRGGDSRNNGSHFDRENETDSDDDSVSSAGDTSDDSDSS